VRVCVPVSSSEIARRDRRSVSLQVLADVSSQSTVSATTFSRSTRLATVAAETSASVPAPRPRPASAGAAQERVAGEIVTPVATVRLVAPSMGGRRSP